MNANYKFLVASLVMFLSFGAHAAVSVGKQAPDFKAKTASGKMISLSEFKGKKVIMEWTNAECPFVVKHYGSGNMQALQKKYTEQGVIWLSVISSAKGKQGNVSASEANALSKTRNAVPTHIILDEDGTLGTQYSAKTTPHMYIVDEKGILQYMGAIDSISSTDQKDIAQASNYIDQAINELTAGKSVSQPVTKAYGCGVKY